MRVLALLTSTIRIYLNPVSVEYLPSNKGKGNPTYDLTHFVRFIHRVNLGLKNCIGSNFLLKESVGVY